ncbi:hypothetical protein EV182_005062, partial [Spiromyces aspiralis]
MTSNSHLVAASGETDLSIPLSNNHPYQLQDEKAKEYLNDPKYAKYVQLVERNLQSFDYVSEWADVTAFLTKLSRAFEIYSQFDVIPHKDTVAKRLAQCLNPALPTGVHQKALQLYHQIFEKIPSKQLAADLPRYSFGLFPFLRNAALKVKPQVLALFEKYYLPMGAKLRPCAKSFIIALLPGLEEERSEVYERVIKLLDKIKTLTDPSFFYQTIFLVMISNPELRLCVLNYLSARIRVLATAEDLAELTGGDSGLIVRAIAA